MGWTKHLKGIVPLMVVGASGLVWWITGNGWWMSSVGVVGAGWIVWIRKEERIEVARISQQMWDKAIAKQGCAEVCVNPVTGDFKYKSKPDP